MKKFLFLMLFFFGFFPMVQNNRFELSLGSSVFAQSPGDEYGDICGGGYDDILYEDEYEIVYDHCTVSLDCVTGEIYDIECETITEIKGDAPDPCLQMGGEYDECGFCVLPGDDGCGDDGDDGGGGGGSTLPDPCDQVAQAAGVNATNVYSNPEVQNSINQISIVPGFPEAGFSVRQSAQDNSIYTSSVETGTSTNVDITNYNNSIADLHVHNSDYPPSATDIFSIVEMAYNHDPPNFKTSFIIANDGTRYALVVTDQSAIIALYNGMNGAIDPMTNNLNPATGLGQTFGNAYDYFFNQLNYSPRDAFERATAAILENSGLILLKADPVIAPAPNTDFKKIGVNSSTDSNQNTTFNNSDCP